MKKSNKLIVVILIIAISCCAVFILGFSNIIPATEIGNTTVPNVTIPHYNLSHYEKMTGPVFINATVAGYSITELPVYYGILREGESVNKFYGEPRACQNVTTPEEAPEVARTALEPYGGLPPDAVSNGAFTQHERVYNSTLKEYVPGLPEATTISYNQKMINGLWTIGDSNYIRVDLGENGELLRIVKEWRNYTYTGDVPVISLETAIDKLERQELIESDWHPEAGDITIDLISPGYYAKEISKNETLLEPLWMFYGGNTTNGARLRFYIYARKFADFAVSPLTGEAPLEVSFFDRSETTPEKWYWDFGDGSDSDLRDPSHVYRQPGIYNVTLTVWNDLGSDTVSKQDFITVIGANTIVDSPVHSGIVNNTQMAEGRL